MRIHFSLIKTIIKLNFTFLSRDKSEDKIQRVGIAIAILLVTGCFAYYYIRTVLSVFVLFEEYNAQNMIVVIINYFGNILTLFVGTFMFANLFCLSKDYDALLYLPIKTEEIIRSKFEIIFLLVFILQVLLQTPVMIVYSSKLDLTAQAIVILFRNFFFPVPIPSRLFPSFSSISLS